MRDTPPVLLDQAVRLVVWSSLLGLLLAPLAGIYAITTLNPTNSGFGAMLGYASSPASVAGTTHAMRALSSRMKKLTAQDGEQGWAASLEVIFVRSAGPATQNENGFRQLQLDIEGVKRTAVLIVAEQPIAWLVASDLKARHARLAFEGPAPFDVQGLKAGGLAGYRITAFGADHAIQPADIIDRPKLGRFAVCRALTFWGNHFGVTARHIHLTTTENLTSLSVSDQHVRHDGTTLAHGQSAAEFCR